RMPVKSQTGPLGSGHAVFIGDDMDLTKANRYANLSSNSFIISDLQTQRPGLMGQKWCWRKSEVCQKKKRVQFVRQQQLSHGACQYTPVSTGAPLKHRFFKLLAL